MTSIVLRAMVGVVCLVTFALPAGAQWSDDEERWDPGHGEACRFDGSYTPEDVRTFREAWDDVFDAATRSTDEWAGVYNEIGADTSYRQIAWTPDAGYVYIYVSTCRAGINDLDFGRVQQSSSVVAFASERAPGSRFPHLLPSRMVRVRWGSWHCLVPETNLEAFCRYAVGRDFAPDGDCWTTWPMCYVKRDETLDLETWGTGIPVVPPEYQRFVFAPLHARITEVGAPFVRERWEGYPETVIPVTVDLGAASGAEVGNVLHVVGSDPEESVEIVEVGARVSRGEIVRPLPVPDADDGSEPGDDVVYPLIVTGWDLATVGPFEGLKAE